jgi:hypothetical protein
LDEEQEEKQPRLSDALSQVAELAHLAMLSGSMAASIKSCLLQLPVSTHGQCADLKTQKYVTSFP